MVPSWFQEGVGPMMLTQFSRFWGPPGDPKSTKKSIFEEKWAPRTVIFSIFDGKGDATHFFIDFSWIFDWKIYVFFFAFFETSLQFFGHGDPHNLLIFTSRNTLFHFFDFSFFWEKMLQNPGPKRHLKKKVKMSPLGAFWGPKMA